MAVSERDVLRKVVRYFKDKFKVKVERTELNSINSCYEAMERVILEANKESLDYVLFKKYENQVEVNLKLKTEILELRQEIDRLKKPFWKKIFG